MSSTTHMALVLGDQLDLENPALQALRVFETPPSSAGLVIMLESLGEAQVVWNHKARIALFLSAMRHFHLTLQQAGYAVLYQTLAQSTHHGLAHDLSQYIQAHKISHLHLTCPGDYRILLEVQAICKQLAVTLIVYEDSHFLCAQPDFTRWAAKKNTLRMEFFYREMRKRYRVLLDEKGQPEGGQWNYDAENRQGFPKAGPGLIPEPQWFSPDMITQKVFDEVNARFANHPGDLTAFRWPVTRNQALEALAIFIKHRLPQFGLYQDAMWTDIPFAWHALLSSSLNLHLLHPLEVIQQVEQAWKKGDVSLASAEGFIRQILGWREFIRGVYWLDMPKMAKANYYNHQRALPVWFWTAKTKMVCMQQTIGQTLRYGYAHHIQRLMVTGNFALLAELLPQQVASWYLAVYVDAVEWVELPNVAGMALFANGGRFTSKPYIASGAYIKRMSNYCQGCSYNPTQRSGKTACPITVLYWYFLHRHELAMAANPRTALMAKNLSRIPADERFSIMETAQGLLENLDHL